MKIFLAHAFRDEDKPLVAEVEKLLRKHSIRAITGEGLGGGQLTPEVCRRIESCEALIAVLTRRDSLVKGGWTTHQWVLDELVHARARGKRAIALVEEGIAVGGISQPHEWIALDRERPEKALLKLTETLREWQGPWRRLRPQAAALALVFIILGGWWWQGSAEVKGAIARSLPLVRAGSYTVAQNDPLLEEASQRWLLGRPARFLRDKAALGAMLESRDDSDLIEKFSQRLRALQTGHPEEDPELLLFAGALALRQLGGDPQRKEVEKVRRYYERALALAPEYPEAHFYLGSLYLMGTGGREHFQKACAHFDQALTGAPHASHYLNARAYAHYRLGDFKNAEDDYRQSAANGLVLSRVELVPLLWRNGKYDEAGRQLNEALLELTAKKLAGRNLLPWSLELEPGKTLTLKEEKEKACYIRLTRQATAALQGEELRPELTNCGVNEVEITQAVAASLRRAMDKSNQGGSL